MSCAVSLCKSGEGDPGPARLAYSLDKQPKTTSGVTCYFIHSFSKYLLSTCYVPHTELSAGFTVVSKRDMTTMFREHSCSVGRQAMLNKWVKYGYPRVI